MNVKKYTSGFMTAKSMLLARLCAGLLSVTCQTVLSDNLASTNVGEILAVYGDAVSQTNPPVGWSLDWNASGSIGDSTGYTSLVCVAVDEGQRKSFAFGVPDEDGALMTNRPSHRPYGHVRGFRDIDGVARYAIASYTLQEDAHGEIWIHNGNLLNGHCTILIYLNDTLLSESEEQREPLPMLFQRNLGKLKKGDAIRVAIGPRGNHPGGFGGTLRFTIEDYPSGQTPGEPVNILRPPITASEPQRDADGRETKYAAQHKAQCEAVLAQNPELVFIGDSITARWPATLLQETFGNYRPVNLGVGGDRVQNVLWRVLNGVLDQVRIKVIVLLIGTNNLSNQFTPEEVVEGIDRLMKALQEKTPDSKILLLGILPRGDSIRNPSNELVRQVNAKLALQADNQKVFFLDVGHALVEPDGSISKEVMPDKLHVALPGFVRMLDAMRPLLNQLLALSSSPLTLAKEGKASYTVVQADDATEPEKFAGTELTNFLDRVTGVSFQKGQEFFKAKDYAAAIEEFRKASEASDLAPEQKARIQLALVEAYLFVNRYLGLKTVEQVEAIQDISESVLDETLLLKIKLLEDVALHSTRDWTDVQKACEAILQRDSLTVEQRMSARQRLADTLFLHIKDYPAARALYLEILAPNATLKGIDPWDVPVTVLEEAAPGFANQQTLRFKVMYNIGRCYLFEKNYPAVRKTFQNILNMQEISEQFQSFARLYIGLAFLYEKNFAAAKEEFEAIQDTPSSYTRLPWDGGRSSYNPAREAKVRLSFIDNPPKVKKVLFVGSSSTVRGDIPGTVMQMCESTPTDYGQIVASEYISMGTSLGRHWLEGGEGPGSLLCEIDSHPWDAVVYEVSYTTRSTTELQQITDHAPRMVERLRAHNILSVIYEVNPFLIKPKQSFDLTDYFSECLVKVPDGSTAFAPAARAIIEYLGHNPTQEKIDELYADRLHMNGKGAYLVSCCIYAALTEQSPVGLYHPEYVTPTDAKLLQELAWSNYQATNPFKTPIPPTETEKVIN